ICICRNRGSCKPGVPYWEQSRRGRDWRQSQCRGRHGSERSRGSCRSGRLAAPRAHEFHHLPAGRPSERAAGLSSVDEWPRPPLARCTFSNLRVREGFADRPVVTGQTICATLLRKPRRLGQNAKKSTPLQRRSATSFRSVLGLLPTCHFGVEIEGLFGNGGGIV